MRPRIFNQMVGAELLKLRRKRSIMWIAGLLSIGIVVIFFGVLEIEHLTNPAIAAPGGPSGYGPAGGLDRFDHAIVLLSVYFGALMAILVGTEAATTDTASGVFRDLVVTGRPRLWLFAVRVPAALIVTLVFGLASLALAIAASFAFAGGLPTPSASFVLDAVLWVCAAQAVMCVIAVGLGSLSGSRAGSLTVLIGFQLIAGRLLAMASALGSSRDWIPSVALGALKPGRPLPDNNHLTMAAGLAVVVLLVWAGVWLAAGAWRTRTCDA
jgi:hypothetical protein